MTAENIFDCQDTAMYLNEVSALYDDNIAQLYKNIGIAVNGLDYVKKANDYHEVSVNWFDDTGSLLDNIDECISNMLSIVNKTTRGMTCEQKAKCTMLVEFYIGYRCI